MRGESTEPEPASELALVQPPAVELPSAPPAVQREIEPATAEVSQAPLASELTPAATASVARAPATPPVVRRKSESVTTDVRHTEAAPSASPAVQRKVETSQPDSVLPSPVMAPALKQAATPAMVEQVQRSAQQVPQADAGSVVAGDSPTAFVPVSQRPGDMRLTVQRSKERVNEPSQSAPPLFRSLRRDSMAGFVGLPPQARGQTGSVPGIQRSADGAPFRQFTGLDALDLPGDAGEQAATLQRALAAASASRLRPSNADSVQRQSAGRSASLPLVAQRSRQVQQAVQRAGEDGEGFRGATPSSTSRSEINIGTGRSNIEGLDTSGLDDEPDEDMSSTSGRGPDLDDLARQILPLVKRMLVVERERRPVR